MKKEVIYTILGGLLLVAIVGALWFWFFGRVSTPATNTGSFGTAQDKGAGGKGSGNAGNGQAPIGTTAGTGDLASGANGQTPITQYTGAGDGINQVPANYTYTPPVTDSGAIWLDGSTPGGTIKSFTPTPINSLNSIDVSGTGKFTAASGAKSSGGTQVPCVAGLLVGLANSAITSVLGSLLAVTVSAPGQNAADADKIMKDFLGCVARTIARAALQKITSTVVDWVNSGFNGQPAFIQNFKQYFVEAADKAAGQFIQSSDLAFFCSPFKQQVKVAVAQSYAHRNSLPGVGGNGSANSCSLTQAVGNADKFLAGDFRQGGWNGLLAYTGDPTNNPFGAYTQGLVTLDNTQQQAKQNVRDEQTLNAFKPVKNAKGDIITPPSVSQGTTQKILDNPIDQLNMAKNFDEILGNLITQLVDRTIYQGLANLSGTNGYASNFSNAQNQQALDAAQSLLANLQGAVQLTQQYGLVQQGSINDLQNAQSQLVTLQNCWSTVASSTTLTAGQTVQATDSAASTATTVQGLETRVTLYNNNITRANTAIAQIQQLQTSALAATTLKEVQAVSAQFAAAQAAGTIVTQADITSAQQDRTTLQSEMAALNQTTAAQLTQCYAFGQ